MWQRAQNLPPARRNRKENPGRKPLERRSVLDGISQPPVQDLGTGQNG